MNSSHPLSKHWLRTFLIIWTSQAFSMFGSLLVQFSLVWWLTQKTGSATILATASLVAFLPMVFIGPFAGAIVDRHNRKMIMILSDSGIAFTTLLLVIITAMGMLAPWHIYVAMFIRSLGQTFHSPAMTSSTTLLVPQEHYTRISGINQALAGAMNIIAPPAGALLLGVMSLQWVLSIDIITAALAITPLLFVHIPQPEIKAASPGTSPVSTLLQDIKSGFLYIYRWKGLFYVLLFALLINFLINPAFSLLPLLVTKHFHGDAIHYGYMESAVGIGIVIGGLALGAWGGFKNKVHTSALGIAGMGIGALLMGIAPGNLFWMGIAGILILGLMNPITNGPLFAIVQARVDAGYQGRVMTVINSIATGLTPLALAIAGPLSDKFGIQTWFMLGGIVCLILPVFMILIKAINTLDVKPDTLSENIAETHQPQPV